MHLDYWIIFISPLNHFSGQDYNRLYIKVSTCPKHNSLISKLMSHFWLIIQGTSPQGEYSFSFLIYSTWFLDNTFCTPILSKCLCCYLHKPSTADVKHRHHIRKKLLQEGTSLCTNWILFTPLQFELYHSAWLEQTGPYMWLLYAWATTRQSTNCICRRMPTPPYHGCDIQPLSLNSFPFYLWIKTQEITWNNLSHQKKNTRVHSSTQSSRYYNT